jgi:hypothetical protein
MLHPLHRFGQSACVSTLKKAAVWRQGARAGLSAAGTVAIETQSREAADGALIGEKQMTGNRTPSVDPLPELARSFLIVPLSGERFIDARAVDKGVPPQGKSSDGGQRTASGFSPSASNSMPSP